MTCMSALTSSNFGLIGPPTVELAALEHLNGKNGVSTFSWLFFIHSFLYLQVMMTCMGARKSLNFGLIGLPTVELAALESLKKIPIGL